MGCVGLGWVFFGGGDFFGQNIVSDVIGKCLASPYFPDRLLNVFRGGGGGLRTEILPQKEAYNDDATDTDLP